MKGENVILIQKNPELEYQFTINYSRHFQEMQTEDSIPHA